MEKKQTVGNILAAVLSLIIPGLGQLLQGRVVMALIQVLLALLLWYLVLGWLIHLWSAFDAFIHKPGRTIDKEI